MNTEDDLVRAFVAQWSRLTDPQVGEQLLADPVLVLGPDGTTPVPREAFIKAVAARAQAVSAVSMPTTDLVGLTACALGERMVLATITWSFSHAGTTVPLVSDFLLHREPSGTLRCVAYLPRTNVMDHLPQPGDR